MTAVTLHSWRKDAITLEDALKKVSEQKLTGFCLSPASFQFAQWNGTSTFSNELSIGQVYEARFFNENLEIRWLRDPEGQGVGSAVCLSESKQALDGWEELPTLSVETLPDSFRLMTGTLCSETDSSTGWTIMDAPRHGKVALPLTGDIAGSRPAYVVREYLGIAPGSAGEDSNWMVVEERIIGINIISGDDNHG